jgi:membrane-bound inhibitor of C-type lysozyme
MPGSRQFSRTRQSCWRHLFPCLGIGASIAVPGMIYSPPASAQEVAYVCTDGTKLVATFIGQASAPGSARLLFEGTSAPVILPQGLSADGGRYADDKTEFWIKGNQARLTRGNRVAECRTAKPPLR